MAFLAWLEGLGFSRYVQESDYAHPILLVFHAIGMAIVVGAVLMLDLRVLGYGRGIPVPAFGKLLRVAWAGFFINAASGLVIFCSNATNLVANWTFQLKIALILAGGVSLWLLWRAFATEGARAGLVEATRSQKVLALLSILFWLGALTAGRMIAYTLSASLAG